MDHEDNPLSFDNFHTMTVVGSNRPALHESAITLAQIMAVVRSRAAGEELISCFSDLTRARSTQHNRITPS